MATTTPHTPPATGPAPTSPALTTRSGAEFGPRPEATALKWEHLLPATKDATEELINWLDSAANKHLGKEAATPSDGESSSSAQSQVNEQQLATSVLISGDRGYGKTTVLLSLDSALRKPETFLGFNSKEAKGQPKRLLELKSKLERLQRSLVWLPSLDVEPLHATANLLATLLVRAREAIDRDHHRKERWAPPSLLEEGLHDPYGKIDKLTKDASFMWSDRRAQDALQGASQDVKAAEIYATFRNDFFAAMEGVAQLLAAREFGHDARKKVLLVLPIDNVDRSAQHLASIIKLMRMVASPRLWFVLAAGRSEFQLFLERTFLKELTDFAQLPGEQRAWEEALAISRRQASAAMHRVLPSAHQIRIKPVTPDEVWHFKVAPGLLEVEEPPQVLWELLNALPLPGSREQEDGLKSLADLFDIEKRLLGPGNEGAALLEEYRQLQDEESGEPRTPETPKAPREAAEEGGAAREQAAAGASALSGDVGEALFFDIQRQLRDARGGVLSEELMELVVRLQSQGRAPTPGERRDNPVLTYAGRLALKLSARGALDLWQAARLRVRQVDAHDNERPGHNRWTCSLCAELSIKLAATMLRSAIDESELPDWASELVHNRILRMDEQDRIVLDLTGKPVRRKKVTTLSDVLEWSGESSQTSAPQALLGSALHLRHLKDDILELHDPDTPGRKVPLPSHVAGWYMILHDLLVLSRERRVLNGDVTSLDAIPAMSVTLHTARLRELEVTRLGFWWIPPRWDTFIDFSIFTTQWKAFLHRTRGLFSSRQESDKDPKDFAASLFVFVLAAWLDNVCSVARPERGGWNWDSPRKTVLGQVVPPRPKQTGPAPCPFKDAEVEGYLRHVVEALGQLDEGSRNATSYGRPQMARNWLDQDVPLMLHPEFLPLFCLERSGLRQALAGTALWKDRWAQNWPFVSGCRSLLIRKTLRESEDFQCLAAEFGGDSRGLLELRKWRLAAGESWEALTGRDVARVRGAP